MWRFFAASCAPSCYNSHRSAAAEQQLPAAWTTRYKLAVERSIATSPLDSHSDRSLACHLKQPMMHLRCLPHRLRLVLARCLCLTRRSLVGRSQLLPILPRAPSCLPTWTLRLIAG